MVAQDTARVDTTPDPERQQLLHELARAPRLGAADLRRPISPETAAVLQTAVGAAKIVGLADNPHGSQESFAHRARLTQYLIEHGGFTRIGLECHAAEGELLNCALMNPQKYAGDVVRDISFWMYKSRVVSDFMGWLQRYNQQQPVSRQVEIFGFDCQGLYPYREAFEFLKSGKQARHIRELAKDMLMAAELSYQCKPNAGPERRAVLRTLGQDVQKRLAEWMAGPSDSPTLSAIAPVCMDALRLILATAEQHEGAEDRYGAVRDRLMAERSLAKAKDAKTILWAHAYHLSKAATDSTSASVQGEHIQKAVGDSYRVIGCVTAAGESLGFDGKALRRFHIPLAPADVQTVEQLVLDALGTTEARLIALNDPTWTSYPLVTHYLGALVETKYPPDQIARALGNCFDGLMLLPTSRCLKLLGQSSSRSVC
ncbi:MAG: erythromycin esterase family protein [Oligoflexia bacterium]|nr:erythromycin esterase family protein [Oligoflexia bacterium]